MACGCGKRAAEARARLREQRLTQQQPQQEPQVSTQKDGRFWTGKPDALAEQK